MLCETKGFTVKSLWQNGIGFLVLHIIGPEKSYCEDFNTPQDWATLPSGLQPGEGVQGTQASIVDP